MPIGSFVVKYDNYESLEPQVMTQRHMQRFSRTRRAFPRLNLSFGMMKEQYTFERYINEGRGMISRPRPKPVTPVSFDNEPMILTQSDMDASDFGVDEAALFNFGSIAWLPLSMAKYTFSTDQMSPNSGVGLAPVLTEPQWP